MEAVTCKLSEYAVTAAQADNASNTSLKSFYRKIAEKAIMGDGFHVMSLGRMDINKKAANWPREYRKVSDFTELGKRCLNRMREQVLLRLPPLGPHDSIPVLLDPLTKSFAKQLLSQPSNLHDDTLEMLKSEHRAIYRVYHKKGTTGTTESGAVDGNNDGTATKSDASKQADVQDSEEEQKMEVDEDEDDERFIFNIFAEAGDANDGGASDDEAVDLEADDVVDQWLRHNVTYNDCLYENEEPFQGKGKVGICELIEKFDSLSYLKSVGIDKFPTIVLLARVHMGKFENGGFQERVFSTAGNAQKYNQANMKSDELEMRTLLCHNKAMIDEGTI